MRKTSRTLPAWKNRYHPCLRYSSFSNDEPNTVYELPLVGMVGLQRLRARSMMASNSSAYEIPLPSAQAGKGECSGSRPEIGFTYVRDENMSLVQLKGRKEEKERSYTLTSKILGTASGSSDSKRMSTRPASRQPKTFHASRDTRQAA